jgi:hypothetical protein
MRRGDERSFSDSAFKARGSGIGGSPSVCKPEHLLDDHTTHTVTDQNDGAVLQCRYGQ